jgi:hypothetical protein
MAAFRHGLGGGAPRAGFRHQAGGKQQRGHHHRAQRPAQAAGFAGGQWLHLRQIVGIAVHRHGLQPGLDDAISDKPANGHDQEGRGRGEDPVVERVDHHRRVQDVRRTLGETGQHRVQRGRDEQGGRKTTGHTAEGGGNTGQRMTPGGIEDDTAQRITST